MKRIEHNCTTGETTEIDLTPEEEAEVLAAQAAEVAAQNTPEALRRAADAAEAAVDKVDPQIVSTLNMTDAEVDAAVNAAFPDPGQRQIIKRLIKIARHGARRVIR